MEHTVSVGHRELVSFSLTKAEADAMIAQGLWLPLRGLRQARQRVRARGAIRPERRPWLGHLDLRQETLQSTIEITAAVIRDLLTIVEVAMPKHLREQDIRLVRARELLKALVVRK